MSRKGEAGYSPARKSRSTHQAQALATAFKLSDRRSSGRRYRSAASARLHSLALAHDLEHMLSIGFPVGGHMEYRADLSLLRSCSAKPKLHDAGAC